MTKRFLALILSLIIFIVMIVGCNQTSSVKTPPTESKPGSTDQPLSEEKENFNLTGFPIVNEPIHLKGFGGRAPESIPWEDCVIPQMYEKMTNIIIKWELADVENITEVRNIKLASGDLPDLFFQARVPVIDQMTYGSAGMFVPLNDLVKKYAPNIQYIFDNEPDVRKMWTMPDGKIYSVSGLNASDDMLANMPQKWWVKMSYIEKYNDGKLPTTTEELYQFLKNVKADNPDFTPLSCHRFSWIRRAFKGSFGLGNRSAYIHEHVSWDEKEKSVSLDLTTDRYKEMLKYMNRLYTEGLLDPAIFTQEMASYVANGKEDKYAVMHGNPWVFGFKQEEVHDENGPNHWYCGVHFEGPFGDDIYSCYMPQSYMPGQFVITNVNKHPEATIRWVDYLLDGDEGSLFFYSGVEGDGYDIDPVTGKRDGSNYTKEITGKQYSISSSYPVYYSTLKIRKGSKDYPEPGSPYLRGLEELYKTKPDAIWGEFTYTLEEAEEMSILKADIEGYVQEVEAKLITGEMSFNEWDTIQNKLKSMGLDRYIEIYNTVAKRFEEG